MRRIALVVLLIIRLTDVSSQSTKNYVKLINSNTSSATYYNNYFSYYNEERIAKEGELNFRQMDFSPLNIEIKWCKKILFVNVCGTETKKIEFGLVLSGKDVPGNESSFDDKRFGTITDMTAFSNEFISDYTLFKNIVLTAAILDNGGRKTTFLREDLVPWDYGINQGESRFVNPISIKYIGGFLYILDNTITPNVKVIKINHSPDGNFNVNYVGDINNTSLGFNLSNPTDITGYFDTDNNSNVLLIADEAGLHKIRLNSTGLINSTTSVSTFLYAENSYNTNIAYDLTDIYKIDSDNSGYTLAILKDNKVISFPNIENNISNTVGVANVTFLNRNLFPTGIAYMFTEQKWYITDITGKIHSFTKDGKFINTAGTVGKGEGNNELYLPNVITPNPISDPQNDFRYRFIIGNNWGYETGFKLFVPYVTIPEISVFESLQDNSLNFSFITSSSWEVVEKATGIRMSKVIINGNEISSSLWNTQITSGNDLTSYPNVFSINPTLLNLNRGWNNVEIQLQLSYSDRGPELIKNKTSFYWLPSQFTGTTSDYHFINSSTGIDFIYKPTTLSGAALLQVNQLLYVTEEGNLTMQENSTFYNPPTVANDFSNIRFFSEETSKISIENGAYFCMSSLISPSGITPPSTAQFALDPGYKTGKNPVITGLSSICKSPCYTLADDKPKAVATAQAFFNTANSRYEAYIDSRGSTYSNSLRYVITKLDINRNETAVSATVLGIGSAPDRLLVNDLFSGFSLENQNEYKIKVTLGCNSDQGQSVPEWIEGSTVTTIIGLKTELKLGDPQVFCERQAVGSITGFSPLSTLVGYTDAGTPKSGFWSGPGVNFAGVISITGDLPRNVAIDYVYTYTDELNFTQTAIKTITITSAPSVSQFGTNSPVCAGKSLSFTCVGTGIAGESKYFLERTK